MSSKPTSSLVPSEVDTIFRKAVACRECFAALKLRPAIVDIAQPRPIGENYWTSEPRIVLVLINPAAGNVTYDVANRQFAHLIHAYARGDQSALSAVFEHQRTDMPEWGDGNFGKLYLKEGFGLCLSNIACANIAWCAEMCNQYGSMLKPCFNNHTRSLLQALKPDVVLLSGAAIGGFKSWIEAACPTATVECVLHYGHRKGKVIQRAEVERVRPKLAKWRRTNPKSRNSITSKRRPVHVDAAGTSCRRDVRGSIMVGIRASRDAAFPGTAPRWCPEHRRARRTNTRVRRLGVAINPDRLDQAQTPCSMAG